MFHSSSESIDTSRALRDIFAALQQRFAVGDTLPLSFRLTQLQRLQETVHKYREEILEALFKDLHKPKLEAYEGEILPVIREISFAIKHLKQWTKKERLPRDPFFPFSRAWVTREPYGVALIMAPYNYPFSINLTILVGAIAAGNCVILKPSERTIHSLKVLQQIIAEAFDRDYVSLATGGISLSQETLTLPFNYIYFVGSTSVGKIVMEAAAKNLIPLSLGLSGKCPAVVDATVPIDRIAKRIVWAKFFNNGQSCTAIDYLLVDRKIQPQFLEKLVYYIKKFYGENAQTSENYGRLVDEKQFDKVLAYTTVGTMYYGGRSDRADRYIEPTIMADIPENAKSRHEEIFGPVLPVFGYTDQKEVTDFINKNPSPLALYVYSRNSAFREELVKKIPSGGVCFNDALIHNTAPYTPGGGVHQSGFGRLHGKYSFETFSYKRPYLKRGTLFDPPDRFPPYQKITLVLLKKIMG